MSDQFLDQRKIEATHRVEIGELEWLLRQKRLSTTQRERAELLLRRHVAEPAARAVVENIESDPKLLAAMRAEGQRRRQQAQRQRQARPWWKP